MWCAFIRFRSLCRGGLNDRRSVEQDELLVLIWVVPEQLSPRRYEETRRYSRVTVDCCVVLVRQVPLPVAFVDEFQ